MEDFSWLSGELHRRHRVFKNEQEKLLHFLSEEVTRTPAVFEQAQKNRDAHEKRLNEMLEETLRQIKKCRAHMQPLGGDGEDGLDTACSRHASTTTYIYAYYYIYSTYIHIFYIMSFHSE